MSKMNFVDFLNEDRSDEIENAMYDYKKMFRKQYIAMSDNEITIKAAKQVAKDLKIKFKDILKEYRPNDNISGLKTWDSKGNNSN